MFFQRESKKSMTQDALKYTYATEQANIISNFLHSSSETSPDKIDCFRTPPLELQKYTWVFPKIVVPQNIW